MIPKNFSTKKLVYVHSSIKTFFHKSLLKGTYTVFTKEYNMGILQTVNSLFKELSLNSEWKFAWAMDRLLNANATTILHIWKKNMQLTGLTVYHFYWTRAGNG